MGPRVNERLRHYASWTSERTTDSDNSDTVTLYVPPHPYRVWWARSFATITRRRRVASLRFIRSARRRLISALDNLYRHIERLFLQCADDNAGLVSFKKSTIKGIDILESLSSPAELLLHISFPPHPRPRSDRARASLSSARRRPVTIFMLGSAKCSRKYAGEFRAISSDNL